MNKVHHITEMWIDEYHTLCQLIMYKPGDIVMPDINPNITILISRVYWDKDNKVIKEEKFNEN